MSAFQIDYNTYDETKVSSDVKAFVTCFNTVAARDTDKLKPVHGGIEKMLEDAFELLNHTAKTPLAALSVNEHDKAYLHLAFLDAASKEELRFYDKWEKIPATAGSIFDTAVEKKIITARSAPVDLI